MANDLTFTAELEDKISPALQKIQREVQDTVGVFVKLRTAVLSIGFGSIIGGAVQFAAAIDDVASSTGMATESVLGFAKAFQQFGGSTEGALTGIARFSNAVDDAAKGNKQAQENFERLGISLRDLENLSEQDLLRKTIQGLAELPRGAEATATAMAVLGKQAATVDFKSVNDGLDAFIEKSQRSAEAVRAAAAAEENFGTAISTFKTELLAALQPISEFFAAIDPKTIQSVIETLMQLGKIIALVAGAFAMFKYVVNPLQNARAELIALSVEGHTVKEVLTKALSGVTNPAKQLKNDISLIGDAFRNTAESGMKGATALERIGVAMGGLIALASRLVGYITVLYAAFEILNTVLSKFFGIDLAGGLDNLGKKAADLLGIAYKTEEQKRKELAAQKDLENAKKREVAEEEKKRQVQAYYQEQLDKEKQTLDKAVRSYQDQNQESLKKFQQQTRLMGLSEEQALIEQERFAAEEAYLKAIKPLEDQIQDIKKKGSEASKLEQGLLPELQARIGQITNEYKSQEPLRERAVAARVRELDRVKDLLLQEQLLSKVYAARSRASQSLEDFDRQTRNLNLTEEQRIAVERMEQVQRGYLQDIQPLLDEYAKLQKKITDNETAGIPVREKEKQRLNEIAGAIKNITKEYEDRLPKEQASIDNRLKELDTQKELVRNAKELTDAYNRRLDVDQALNEISLRGIKSIKDATDKYIDSTLTPLQRRLAEITREENNLREATIKRIAAQYNSDDEFGDPQKAQEFADRINEIDKATKNNIQTRQAQASNEVRYQQSFTSGWIKAYREYTQAATDASKRAYSLFQKTTQGLEDLFVNFAKTGKFEWKKFVNDLGEEILRSQLRSIIGSVFGDMTTAMSSGEGFMGALGKLLGFGPSDKGTQNNPMYVIDLASVKGGMGVGSNQGGGFFDTLLGGIKNIGSSIWNGVKSIGSAIGGIFGGGSSSSGGGGFLGSIVKGIGSLFGGFFANGGTLGAGRWGIAGERGPELITGPATINPMIGSSVNYYISAVDALSFQQLVARDPSFIHAVAMQGAKGMARR